MILSNLFVFAVVVLAVWVNMAIAKLIAGIWLDDEKATIAAFAFALGSLAGLKHVDFYDGSTAGLWLGVIVAYGSAWWVHFGRARWEAKHG